MLEKTLTLTKALADENRLRALAALTTQELCACQIITLLVLAPSTVSKHMTILKEAGLVAARKEGRWVHYSLPKHAPDPLLDHVLAILSESAAIKKDRKRLKEILKTDPEELCRCLMKRN